MVKQNTKAITRTFGPCAAEQRVRAQLAYGQRQDVLPVRGNGAVPWRDILQEPA
jgi:hypothetical protein